MHSLVFRVRVDADARNSVARDQFDVQATDLHAATHTATTLGLECKISSISEMADI